MERSTKPDRSMYCIFLPPDHLLYVVSLVRYDMSGRRGGLL